MVHVPFVHLSALLPGPWGLHVGSWATLALGLSPQMLCLQGAVGVIDAGD